MIIFYFSAFAFLLVLWYFSPMQSRLLEKCSSQAHIDFSVSQIVSALAGQMLSSGPSPQARCSAGSVSIKFDFYYHLALLCGGAWCLGPGNSGEITMSVSIMCALRNWIDFFNYFPGCVALNCSFAPLLDVNLLWPQVGWQNLTTGSSW